MNATEGFAMGGNDKRKQSLYFPEDMLDEITKEADRLDRSLSWVVQHAWIIASKELGKFPSMNDVVAAPEAGPGRPEAAPASAPDHQPGSQVSEFLRGRFENL